MKNFISLNYLNNYNKGMDTKIYSSFNQECINIINQGEVLAFPTETVFGFGVVYDNVESFNKMCKLKNRMPDKPFTIMISSPNQINEFVEINDKMKKLIDKFMPGELTLLLPSKKGLPFHLTLNESTVGIRMPNDQKLLSFIEQIGKPLLVTSANMSNEKPLLDSQNVFNQFNGKIVGIVEGKCVSNVPSTIVLVNGNELKLIREGNLKFIDIEKEWKK